MQGVKRIPVIEDAVTWADLEGESVLLNVLDGVYFGLNEVGTMIWKLISEGLPEDQIAVRMLADFEVTLEDLQKDVKDFLQILEEKKLIHFQLGGTPSESVTSASGDRSKSSV